MTDTLLRVSTNDQAGAKSRIADLETAWDEKEQALQPLNESAWHAIDNQIDIALHAIRSGAPRATEEAALTTLANSLQSELAPR